MGIVTVHYYADPEKITQDHIGNYLDMTENSRRVFSNEGQAIAFLDECTRPITCLSEILTKNESLKEADYILKHKRLGYEIYEDVFDNLMN